MLRKCILAAGALAAVVAACAPALADQKIGLSQAAKQALDLLCCIPLRDYNGCFCRAALPAGGMCSA